MDLVVVATATPDQTMILDDATGSDGGLALPAWFRAEMKSAFVDDMAPKVAVPNIEQEVWMTKAATRIGFSARMRAFAGGDAPTPDTWTVLGRFQLRHE